MSRTHAAIDGPSAPAPRATRARPPGWKDPRLWVGVAIVAASVVAGSRILGAADDSVTVWAAARDVAPGDTVRADDLVSTSVRFSDDTDLRRYLLTSSPLPDDLRLTRGVGTGELLPVAALGSGEEADSVIVSLSFPRELIPTNIGAGSVIELLVIPDESDERAAGTQTGAEAATTVVTDVVVIDAPSATDSLGGVGRGRQLVLGIPETDDGALGEILAASEDQRVRVLVRG